MRGSTRTILAAVLAVMAGSAGSDAEACSCLDPGPPCQAYWTTEAIFRGRVEGIEPVPSGTGSRFPLLAVRFAILESFKGITGTTAVVTTTTGPASCGFRFTSGREYLVYASRVDGRLVTSTCARTAPAGKAHDDLEYARSIAGGGTTLGWISGRVLLRVPSLWSRSPSTRAMPDVPVTIRAGELAFETVTDRRGDFAVTGLAPGAYTVSLDPRGRFRVDVMRNPVEIKDARGCAVVQADVYPDGRVSGRVTDTTGRPVSGLTVDLTARRTDGRAPDRLRAVTRADGRYDVMAVPPGRFILGVNTAPDRPDPRAYHPGVVREADAETVVMTLGGNLELRDFVLPAGTRLIEVAGVVFEDGWVPAEGARVYLKEPGDRGPILTEPILTDPSGRFTITALAGCEYLLFAERPRTGDARGRMDSTELTRIEATAGSPRVRLTLRQNR